MCGAILLGALLRTTTVALQLWAVGKGGWNFCIAAPHCLGAVGRAIPSMHCLTFCGQLALELLLWTVTSSEGSAQWNSCNALPHCMGAVGSGTPVMHCHIASGQWALELLQYAPSLPRGSEHRNSCNALPHRLGAVGSGSPATRGPFCWGDEESRHEAVVA